MIRGCCLFNFAKWKTVANSKADSLQIVHTLLISIVIGKWSIDLNVSAMWRTKDQIQKATETSTELGDQLTVSKTFTLTSFDGKLYAIPGLKSNISRMI